MRRLALLGVTLTILLPGMSELSLASGAGASAACREAGASFALGGRYSERLARRARRGADASMVRKIGPGQAYTMEFRADRLNLEVDRRGRVRSVRCG